MKIQTSQGNVYGLHLDSKTRCQHYHKNTDIVAIRLACCQIFYACYQCHQALTDHPATRWTPPEFEEKALLCGNCQTPFSIRKYLRGRKKCPNCQHNFNPNCSKHLPCYFEV